MFVNKQKNKLSRFDFFDPGVFILGLEGAKM